MDFGKIVSSFAVNNCGALEGARGEPSVGLPVFAHTGAPVISSHFGQVALGSAPVSPVFAPQNTL